MKRKEFFIIGILLIFMLGAFAPAEIWSQEESDNVIPLVGETVEETLTLEEEIPVEDQGNMEKLEKMSMFQLIKKGGIVGYLIILLSVVALGLVIDYAITIRRSKLAPPGDIAILRKLIRDHKFEELKKLDQERTSFLSQVVIAGLKEVDFGYQTMIKAMEDASEWAPQSITLSNAAWISLPDAIQSSNPLPIALPDSYPPNHTTCGSSLNWPNLGVKIQAE